MKAPPLEPGRVYRAADFKAHSKQPSKLVARLVNEGTLRSAGHGLHYEGARGERTETQLSGGSEWFTSEQMAAIRRRGVTGGR